MIQSVNPATGEVLRQFDPLSPEALESRLALAAETAPRYAAETLEHRRFWMRRLALLLEGDREDLAALMVAEVGKTIRTARAEVDKCVLSCRYYAENAARILESEEIPTEHAQSYVRWDPLGVILAIMPWNFPLWQVFRFIAPALMAGNITLLKHAPNVPQCALAIEALVRRAGFPRGTVQCLLVETETTERILGDRRVVAVTLTGSEAAGRAVAAQAGYLLKKSVLELGGSDPFIVLPSADLPTAVSNAVRSRSINNGQSCIAAKRFIIHTDIYEAFERDFVEAMGKQKVGDPTLEDTDIGPLISAAAVSRLNEQTQAAVAAGGKLLLGGKPRSGAGFFVEPTVIAGLPRTSAVYREETFGPLAFLFRANSLNHALDIANDTPFGLGASCWTEVPAEQERLAAELQAGAVFFNTSVASDPRLPFGGVKQSGYGRELSAAGMREFLNAKTVVVGLPADQPQQTDFAFTPEPLPPVGPLPPQEQSMEQPAPRRGSTLGLSSK